MNALTVPTMPLQDMQTLAVAIAKSALFGIRTPEQALVLMAIAQAEGRHPVEAARDYDIINNRPAKKAEAMLRDFIQAGGKVQWHSLTDELADATFTHPQTGEVRIDWDMKRAATAFGKKDMYSKFPRQMLRSRVVSEGVRTLWPLATSGMYEPGEAADIPARDEHNGPTIEAEATADARDALNDTVPLKAAAAKTQRGSVKRGPPIDTKNSHAVLMNTLDGELGWHWMQALTKLLQRAQSLDYVENLGGHKRVADALADPATPDQVKREITALLAEAYKRFAEPEEELLQEPEPDPDPELAVVGERYAAG